ncbi:MAG: tyrosine-protein phosphatase [Candidatus Binatia bacterium]
MSRDPRRVIALDGCLNFRDLGGYPTRDGRRVRWRQVFRSDALQLLSASDVARLRGELRIERVIDLRSTAELRSEGRGRLAAEPIQFQHIPLFDGEMQEPEGNGQEAISLGERYFLLAQFAMRPIARVISTLAATTAPAVYHCAAGKDRTGIVSAVVLGLLGVEDDAIVADYALTQDNLYQIVARLEAAEGYQTMLAALPPDTLHAQPETMRALLGKVKATYRSMEGYALAAGIPAGEIQRLRDRLLE